MLFLRYLPAAPKITSVWTAQQSVPQVVRALVQEHPNQADARDALPRVAEHAAEVALGLVQVVRELVQPLV